MNTHICLMYCTLSKRILLFVRMNETTNGWIIQWMPVITQVVDEPQLELIFYFILVTNSVGNRSVT
jgi:hypothetical protein